MADIIKSRRDTAENWRTANPTLAEGELGFETDTKRYKLGDGKTAWNSLGYFDRDVDDEPTKGSENLVTSGGVFSAVKEIESKINGKITPLYRQGTINGNTGEAFNSSLTRVTTNNAINIGNDVKIVCKQDILIASVVFYANGKGTATGGTKNEDWKETNFSVAVNEYVVKYDSDFPNIYIVFKKTNASDNITVAEVESNVTIYSGDSIQEKLELLKDKIGEAENSEVRSDSNSLVSSKNIYSFVDGITTKLKDYTNGNTINSAIKELYIDSKYRKIRLIEITDANCRIIFANKNNENLVIANFNYTEGVINLIIDNANVGYILLTGEKINISNNNGYDITEKAYTLESNTTIQEYLLFKNNTSVDDDNKETVKVNNWSSNSNTNNHIKELYIPELTSIYGNNCYIGSIILQNDRIRLFLYKEDGTLFAKAASDITKEYYSVDAVSPIYLESENRANVTIVGWVVFNRSSEEYAISGVKHILNDDVVSNLDNSSKIKSMLSSEKQIILCGDSKLGYPSNNSLPDIIRGLTGLPVWNIACGGCRMSWRTSNGSNFYDKFTFVSLMDAVSSGNFSEQEEALNSDKPTSDFGIQLANMKSIDLTKETWIFCNYMTNDFTGDAEIGELWDRGTDINNFNKNTYLGALNYGLTKIMGKYPTLKFTFSGNAFRIIDGKPNYEYQNALNKTAEDYNKALIENCRRLGINYVDELCWGVRNYFGINTVTTDGTHFNAKGFFEFAKYIKSLVY